VRNRLKIRFTGGQIVGEFLLSLGYLPGARPSDIPDLHGLPS